MTPASGIPFSTERADGEARLQQLEGDVRDLRAEIGTLRDEQRELAESLGWLRAHAVRPECSEDGTRSVNPANQRSSECRPYGCNMAEGVCYTQCSLTEHCARNYVCDVPHCRHHSEF